MSEQQNCFFMLFCLSSGHWDFSHYLNLIIGAWNLEFKPRPQIFSISAHWLTSREEYEPPETSPVVLSDNVSP
jgi:hypothetical protein